MSPADSLAREAVLDTARRISAHERAAAEPRGVEYVIEKNMPDSPVVRIEKGIPVPPPFHTGKRTYPLSEMEIGDSFQLPPGVRATGVHAQAYELGIRVTLRRYNGWYRVWRLA